MDPKFEQQRERSIRAFYLHKREGFLSACLLQLLLLLPSSSETFLAFFLQQQHFFCPLSQCMKLIRSFILFFASAREAEAVHFLRTKPRKRDIFPLKTFLCLHSLGLIFSVIFQIFLKQKIRPIFIPFFRRLLDKNRRVFCTYVLEKLIYTRVISSS